MTKEEEERIRMLGEGTSPYEQEYNNPNGPDILDNPNEQPTEQNGSDIVAMRSAGQARLAEQKNMAKNYAKGTPYNATDYKAQTFSGGEGFNSPVFKSGNASRINGKTKGGLGGYLYNEQSKQGDEEEKKEEKSATDILNEWGLIPSQEELYQQQMENAPEYVSEEEEARRIKHAQTSKTIADLGSLASAFANLYYTTKEAPNQTVAYAESPNYQQFIDKWQGQRNAYRNFTAKAHEYAYQRRKQYLDDAYQRDLEKLKLAQAQANIELTQAKTTAQQETALRALEWQNARIKDLADKYQLALDKNEETKRMHDATIANNNARLAETIKHNRNQEAISRYNAEHKGGGGTNSNWHVANASGLSVDIPKANINDFNRGELLKLTGSDGYKEEQTSEIDVSKSSGKNIVYKTKKVKMTKDEIWNHIVNNMNPKAEEYIKSKMGGQVVGSISEESKGVGTQTETPKPNPAPIYKASDGSTWSSEAAMNKHEEEIKKKKNGSNSANSSSSTKSSSTSSSKGKKYDENGRQIIDW